MTKIKLFCILALLVLIAVPAYAEVQNVKVSGDLAARWLLRATYDLDKDSSSALATNSSDAVDNFQMTTAEVQVDADLTDNVATVVRLVNQRNWGDPQTLRSATPSSNAFDVLVDLANVTLKEFVYSPLTLTIGRQDLWFGKGFIVGAKQRDPNNSITAKEYTAINSFDAIKATLDFDPWKIDGVYSMLENNVTNKNDDIWMLGANAGYKFDSYNGEAEAYVWHKVDKSGIAYINGNTTAATNTNLLTTYGLRGSLEPIANATVAAEGAMQFGRYSVLSSGTSQKRQAWALDVSGDYLFKDVKWTPKVGLEYIVYSGDSDDNPSTTNTKWEGWDPMYRGKFDTAIREFQNVYYPTVYRSTYAANTVVDGDSGATNEQQIIVIGSLKPLDVLKFDARFAWFRFMENPRTDNSGKAIGTELDLQLTYDYTEDVSFNLLAGWFFPGGYWISGQDDTATDLVGTVKVAF
ncbi:MAG: alginate export family protein [Candidatus Omnitrophica bacterium]|nr:alginate export family protein [Candidatus Omnitrophota bacterium]